MLKQRVITALILLPLVLAAIFYLPSPLFSLLVATVVMLAAFEWSRMMAVAGRHWQVAFMLLTVLAMVGLYVAGQGAQAEIVAITGLAVGVLWWALACLWVVVYPHGLSAGQVLAARKLVAGLVLLVPAWLAISLLHGWDGPGPALVLVLFVIVWAADIGAYFAGHGFGRVKLAPHISPGKTLEGAAGGLLAALLAGTAGGWLVGVEGVMLAWFAVLVLIVTLVSIVGDLTVSMFKRHSQVKDSGGLLPGHGGVLDRVDSLSAAAPVFVFGLELAGLVA